MCYREVNLIINKNIFIIEIIAGNEQITPMFFVFQKNRPFYSIHTFHKKNQRKWLLMTRNIDASARFRIRVAKDKPTTLENQFSPFYFVIFGYNKYNHLICPAPSVIFGEDIAL